MLLKLRELVARLQKRFVVTSSQWYDVTAVCGIRRDDAVRFLTV
jgi:hypothetical protein